MIYRKLGNTGLLVSEIGLGGEWLERHNAEEVKAVVDACRAEGINIIDCFMSEPNVRSNIGNAIQNDRENWIIQGHIGSAWRNGQYVRTRDLAEVKEHYAALQAHASDCISCRACEGRCPFEVKITDRMKQTAELFGY